MAKTTLEIANEIRSYDHDLAPCWEGHDTVAGYGVPQRYHDDEDHSLCC